MRNLARLRGHALYQALLAVISPLVRNIYYRELKVEGGSNIPRKGPFIILSYHDSERNILELSSATNRTLVYVARSGIFKRHGLGTLMRWTNNIELERETGKNIKDTRSGLENAVNNEVGIVIFPEGTRNTSGVVGRGGYYLVRKATQYAERMGIALPIVPAGIEACPRRLRGSVTVRFSEPVFKRQFPSLDKLIDGYAMPRVAELSGKPFDPKKKAAYIRCSAPRNN